MRIDSFDSDKQMTSSVANNSTEANASIKTQTDIKEPEKAEKTNFEGNAVDKKNLPVSEKFIIDTIERANKAIDGARTEFKFSIHKQTHEIMIKVLDKDSGKVIREIPPEKTLDMVAKMWEMAGIIVDEKR